MYRIDVTSASDQRLVGYLKECRDNLSGTLEALENYVPVNDRERRALLDDAHHFRSEKSKVVIEMTRRANRRASE